MALRKTRCAIGNRIRSRLQAIVVRLVQRCGRGCGIIDSPLRFLRVWGRLVEPSCWRILLVEPVESELNLELVDHHLLPVFSVLTSYSNEDNGKTRGKEEQCPAPHKHEAKARAYVRFRRQESSANQAWWRPGEERVKGESDEEQKQRYRRHDLHRQAGDSEEQIKGKGRNRQAHASVPI